MSTVVDRLRALLGAEAVETDPDGLPRAVPDTAEAAALLCRVAHEEGWRIRVEGNATWLAPDAPADLAVSTRALNRIVSVSPADLVATVEAGVTMDVLRRALAGQGAWLALDPPGRPDRTLGSVVATATAGPLRHGFGGVRDHILGCTVATGDGRLVLAGSRVVKNVAGYDLTKLQIGGFGGFGIITEMHLRLRTLPRADVTFLARGARDSLTRAARVLGDRLMPSALELLSPPLAAESEWVLAARFLGAESTVHAGAARLAGDAEVAWEQLPAERSASFWSLAARAALGGPVTIRLGALSDGIDETIDLLAGELDEGLVSAAPASGLVRWSGEAAVERLRAVRRSSAAREIPMTLERGPWPLRRALGHFGAYREGVGQLVTRLRATFDPGLRLSVALEGADE